MSLTNRSVMKSVLITSGIFLIIIGGMLYFYLRDPNRNYLYYDGNVYIEVMVPVRDLQIGEIVNKNSVTKMKYNKMYIYHIEDVYVNEEDIIGKKMLYPVFTGQIIYKKYTLSKEEWYDGKTLFPIEVDIETTVANSVLINDYIDINVVLEEKKMESNDFINYDVVIAKRLVEDIKDEHGNSFWETGDGSVKPKYVLVKLTPDEIDRYLDAKRMSKGKIFLTIYEDPTSPPSKITYQMMNEGRKKNEQ